MPVLIIAELWLLLATSQAEIKTKILKCCTTRGPLPWKGNLTYYLNITIVAALNILSTYVCVSHELL